MRRAMDAACEPKGMGSEQLDSKTHFEGHSMNIAADAPSADSPYDKVYSTTHANKDTKSYFDAGMTLSDEADAGLAFDRVFGSQHEAARAETAFKNGFQLKKGYSVPRCSAPRARPASAPAVPPHPPHRCSMRTPSSPLTRPSFPRTHSPPAPFLLQVANMLDPLKFDGKKNRDLAPPPRAKFLHFRPTREPTLQERMDEVVYPMAEVVKPALNPNLSQGELEKAQSRGDFAWGSDRIAHELATKLDQFTRRPEDAVRKLLWTVGTEHRFEGKSRNSIAVTPKNLTGLCNRFGLACNDGQARRRAHARAPLTAHTSAARTPLPPVAGTPLVPHAPPHGGTPFPCTPRPTPRRQAEQIFERHRLPRDGCSVQTLSTTLLNPQVDTAQLARAEGRRALGSPYASSTRFSFAQGPRTPRVSKVTRAPAPDPDPSPSTSPDADAD